MSRMFDELDFRPTPMGDLSLRRRLDPAAGVDVFEVKLGEAFLMSSLFTDGEVALAERGLAACTGQALDIVVGGLGLGYTAAAALDHPRLRSLVVIDALQPVIDWHRRRLVPLGGTVAGDVRCRLVHGDFFALARDPAAGFDPDTAARRFDAVLLDVDHSPRFLLDERHAAFYEPTGLAQLAAHLRPAGVFALWSNDAPDAAFLDDLRGVFAAADAEVVRFGGQTHGRDETNTVYIARKAATA